MEQPSQAPLSTVPLSTMPLSAAPLSAHSADAAAPSPPFSEASEILASGTDGTGGARGAPPPGAAVDDAESLFDPTYYAQRYPDVVAAGFEPIAHWRGPGCREGRRPSAWFDPIWYASRFRAADDVQDQAEVLATALAHFAHEGNAAFLPPSPEALAALEREARVFFDEAYYLECYPDVAASTFTGWQHYLGCGWRENRRPSRAFDPVVWRAERMPAAAEELSPLLHYVASGAGANVAVLSEDDADLLASSVYFDAAFYAGGAGLDPATDPLALARHYLDSGEAAGHAPSALFDVGYYRSLYSRLPKRLTAFECRADAVALVHFLRTGRAAGFYPDPISAFLEIELIRGSDEFNPQAYIGAVGRPLWRRDVVADYALYGHLEGVRGSQAVDDQFIRSVYGPLMSVEMRTPLAFYLRHASRPFMFRNATELAVEARRVRTLALFDAEVYARNAGIEGATTIDPAEHYLTEGLIKGISPGPEFNVAAYVARYPDLSQVRIEPMEHYERHGRSEGRSFELAVTVPAEGGRAPDLARPLTLLFSHEASRTGAPIVALNLGRRLADTRDIVVWIGDPDGPLLDDFAAFAVAVRAGWPDPRQMRAEIERLVEGRKDVVAVVNSVVSHPAIQPLRSAGVPIVSLIHEFADYVSPSGTTALMAAYSDRAVFPARIVEDACKRELAAIGVAGRSHGFRRRHQGQNLASGKCSEAVDTSGVRVMLGLEAEARPERTDRILLGVGQIQPRKGVDLFLQAASRLMAEGRFDWRFVWIGGGYEPDKDMVTSVYLRQQIQASGLNRRTVFLPPQPDLEPFWAASDVFFLSSRLDPFPNVVLDAWVARRPVVCFDGATGVTEIDAARPFALTSVPHSDAAAAADAISGFAADLDAVAAGFAGDAGRRLFDRLDFDSYVKEVAGFCAEAQALRADCDSRRAARAALSRADRIAQLKAVPASARMGSGSIVDTRLELECLAWAAQADGLAPSPSIVGYANDTWQLPTEGHVVHIHVSDKGEAAAFVADPPWIRPPLGWAARFLAHCNAVVTAPDPALAAAFAATLAMKNASTLPERFADPLAAIATVAAKHGTRRITVLPLAFEPVPAAAGRRVPEEIADMLALLFCGAADAALEADPETEAVLPALRRDAAGADVRAFLSTPLGPRMQRAPRMIGTWRAERLLERLDAFEAVLTEARLGLDLVGRLELASCLLAAAEPRPRYRIGPPIVE